MENSIELKNITKIYKIYKRPLDRLKEALNPLKRKYHENFFALKEISFNVKKGETLGIIGKNGSGKSTLLKIITGVLSQSNGDVFINGRISALLELGAGLNPEFTGLQNIYLNGSLMGLSREQINLKLPEILEFAEIGEFINQPVKVYSSGMFVRLAFSVAINVDPDILIVDEALSVGDIRFQQKCYRKIKEFREKGTVIFVTHDLGAVTNFCDRAIWINDGTIVKEGIPDEVLEEYHSFMHYNEKQEQVKNRESNEISSEDEIENITSAATSFGTLNAEIIGANIFKESSKVSVISGGELINLIVKIKVNKNIKMPILGFIIKDRLGNEMAIVNTEFANFKLNEFMDDQILKYKWSFHFPKLKDGAYSLDLAIGEGTYENHIQHHWINDALIVEVRNKKRYSYAQGFCFIDNIEFENI